MKLSNVNEDVKWQTCPYVKLKLKHDLCVLVMRFDKDNR